MEKCKKTVFFVGSGGAASIQGVAEGDFWDICNKLLLYLYLREKRVVGQGGEEVCLGSNYRVAICVAGVQFGAFSGFCRYFAGCGG